MAGDLVAPRVADGLGVPFLDRALPESLDAASAPHAKCATTVRVTIVVNNELSWTSIPPGDVQLARTREAGPRAARRSSLWRSQVGPVVRESEHAGHLDLLHASCLMLTRTAILTSPDWRRRLARPVRELAEALARVAADPGDRATRQAAVEGALDAVRPLAGADASSEFETGAALAALQAVALDVMVFAGVDPAEARAAVKAGTGQFEVPTPPPTTRTPFGSSRARPH